MAVISVTPKTGATSSIDEKGQTQYTRLFTVVTDSPLTGGLAILESNGVPAIGDIYVGPDGEFDAQSICKSVQPKQDSENPVLWEVSAEYGAPQANQDQQNQNPLLRPAVITWGFNKFQRPVWRDVNNKAILNSVGFYFDPAIEIDDSRPILTITRNEPVFNPGLAIQYQNAINSDNFFGASPGQCKVAGISAQSQTENNYFFWQISYEFEFRRDLWQLQILNQGRYRKWKTGDPPAEEGYAQPIEVKGVHVSDPVPIDTSGQPIANPTPDNAYFKPFDVYQSLAFTPLALP